MSIVERVAAIVFLVSIISWAVVLVTRDCREPIGRTRAEILSRLADEQAIAEDLDEGRS